MTPSDSGTGSSAFLFQPSQPVPFKQAWDLQRCWQEGLLADPPAASGAEAVWLLEHPSCYTLGRGASEEHLLFDRSDPPAPLHRIDRGGEVTHHTPGQLVVYPVLDLRRHQPDLHWYMRQLEQVALDVLQTLGLQGERIDGLTGVWLDQRKVAAIGVGCRRWITQHGLALNITCDLQGFNAVVPCGLAGRSVGRLCDWIPDLSFDEVQVLTRDALASRFRLHWLNAESEPCLQKPD